MQTFFEGKQLSSLWAFVILEPDESRRGVEARSEQDSPVGGERAVGPG